MHSIMSGYFDFYCSYTFTILLEIIFGLDLHLSIAYTTLCSIDLVFTMPL